MIRLPTFSLVILRISYPELGYYLELATSKKEMQRVSVHGRKRQERGKGQDQAGIYGDIMDGQDGQGYQVPGQYQESEHQKCQQARRVKRVLGA